MAAAMGGVAVMRMGFVPHYGAREGGSVQRFPFLELEPKATLGMAFYKTKIFPVQTRFDKNLFTLWGKSKVFMSARAGGDGTPERPQHTNYRQDHQPGTEVQGRLPAHAPKMSRFQLHPEIVGLRSQKQSAIRGRDKRHSLSAESPGVGAPQPFG